MNRHKTYARSGWNQSVGELIALFVLTAIAVAHLFDLHWTLAVTATPVVMLGLLVAVVVLVEAMWLVVIGLEKLGTAVGLRKSPLA